MNNVMLFLSATFTTVELAVISLLIGLTLAILMTLGGAKHKIMCSLIDGFIFLIRGTPLLVQIFIIYYGSAQFEWLRESSLWFIFKQPFSCAIIALALNTCAYTTVLFRGAIKSIPKGEVEACQALGMSKSIMMRKIILPRAIQIALPAYSNEVIMVLKSTSLVSTITIVDITGITNKLISQTYDVFTLIAISGCIYLCLNTFLMGICRLFEKNKKYNKDTIVKNTISLA